MVSTVGNYPKTRFRSEIVKLNNRRSDRYRIRQPGTPSPMEAILIAVLSAAVVALAAVAAAKGIL